MAAVTGKAGWYIGRILSSGVASAKGGTSPEVQDTVFQWSNTKTAPTPTTVNVTDLTAIVGGPYPTEAAARTIAGLDKNTTSGLPGTNPKPAVTKSTVNSSNGNLPNPLSGIDALYKSVETFINDLSSANLWIRVAKVTIGGTLLIVGLAKLTGADQKIGGVAAKAVKIAPLL